MWSPGQNDAVRVRIMIYKISPRADWEQVGDVYRGSADDKRDGFIHFSTAAQLRGTLEKHYARQTDLVLIAVDETALGSAVRFEASRDGALFPHLYGILPLSAVRWVRPIPHDASGGFVLPL